MNKIHSEGQEILPHFLRALQDEIASQPAQSFQFSVRAPWGRWVYTTGSHHIYEFRTEEALKENTDSRICLHQGDTQIHGTLVSTKGLIVRIAFESYIGEEIFRSYLSVDSKTLLVTLVEALKSFHELSDLNDVMTGLLKPLVKPLENSKSGEWQNEKDHAGDPLAAIFPQLDHIKRLFVWGPAGTGKTQALARLASSLILKGESVLITGNTHVSINNSLARTLEILQKDPAFESYFGLDGLAGKVLRFGLMEAQGKNSLGQKTMLLGLASPEQWIRDFYPDLWDRRTVLALDNKIAKDQWQEWRQNNRLDTKRAHLLRQKLIELEAGLQRVNEHWRDALKKGLQNAQVVGTTLAQIYLNRNLRMRSFDTVLVDEASMALLPAVYLAASLAKKRVIIFGDFRQLPPIVRGKTAAIKHWLARDIFEFVGIDRLVAEGKTAHPELIILRHQRRMAPSISALSNALFYHGLLCDDPSVKNLKRNETNPGVVVYDTGSCHPWCTRRGKGEGKSRINLYHAMVAVGLAQKLIQKRDQAPPNGLGIITPYREQAKLIQNLLDDRELSGFVTVATVHQFQGEERDYIIWDTVDSHGFPISLLLEGGLGTPASRMINVAITRARLGFFVICDRTFLLKNLSQEAVLRKALCWLDENDLPFHNAEEIISPALEISGAFLEDLKGAQKNVVISCPLFFGPRDTARLKDLEKLIPKGVTILLDTLRAKHQREILQNDYRGPPSLLGSKGVTTIFHDFPDWRKFLRPNLVIIDGRICWFSDQNFWAPIVPLAFRLTGPRTLEDLNQFFGLSILQDAPQLHVNCPLCQGPMVLMWNRRKYGHSGEYFAACSEDCGYKRPLLRGEKKDTNEEKIRVRRAPPSLSFQKVLPGFLPPALNLEKARYRKMTADTHVLDSCPQCGSKTSLRYNPDRYLFVGCSTWPTCDFKRNYQEDCATCGGQLVIRRSQRGIFLGCLNYPQCRNTKNVQNIPEKFQLIA